MFFLNLKINFLTLKVKKFLSILNEDEVNTDDYYLVEVKIK
jgi:hypothetical protein